MDNSPVCVFDSGLGGLTAVRILRKLMPNENIVYFGDTGRMPYGGRSAAQIRLIAQQNLDFAQSFGVKAIIAACGTISSNAADLLLACPVKTVGVLAPGVRELAQTGKKRLGVIATATSIKSGSFQRELSALAPDAEICALACPDFVPMIESGRYLPSDPEVRATVARSLSELKERKTEALLLGCTHYGLIADAIRDFLGDEIELIGAADAAARELCAYIEDASAFGDGGGEEYYTSGSIADFEALAPLMLGYELKAAVNHVPPFPLEVL